MRREDLVQRKNFRGLFINGERSGYAPDQCYDTLTIRQLIEQLEGIAEWAGDECPVYLYNDDGYTYGHINEDTMNVGYYSDGKGAEFDSFEYNNGSVYYN